MKHTLSLLLLILLAPAASPQALAPTAAGAPAPFLIGPPHVNRGWMFSTTRRANVPQLPGVSWCHATRIGIAESPDHGVTWNYLRTADIQLPPELAGTNATHWA